MHAVWVGVCRPLTLSSNPTASRRLSLRCFTPSTPGGRRTDAVHRQIIYTSQCTCRTRSRSQTPNTHPQKRGLMTIRHFALSCLECGMANQSWPRAIRYLTVSCHGEVDTLSHIPELLQEECCLLGIKNNYCIPFLTAFLCIIKLCRIIIMVESRAAGCIVTRHQLRGFVGAHSEYGTGMRLSMYNQKIIYLPFVLQRRHTQTPSPVCLRHPPIPGITHPASPQSDFLPHWRHPAETTEPGGGPSTGSCGVSTPPWTWSGSHESVPASPAWRPAPAWYGYVPGGAQRASCSGPMRVKGQGKGHSSARTCSCAEYEYKPHMNFHAGCSVDDLMTSCTICATISVCY